MNEQRKTSLYLLCLSFLLLILGVGLLFFFYDNVAKWKLSMSWPSTGGTITTLNFVDRSDADSPPGTSFIVKLQYSYQVEGKSYTSKQINQGIWLWMVDQKGRKWFEENGKVGRQVEVFYNPASPSEAILIKGKAGCEGQTLFLAIPMILIGVTLLIFLYKTTALTHHKQ